MNNIKKKLTSQQKTELLTILQNRFFKHPARHNGIEWSTVLSKLDANPEKLWSLFEMERTGGEPDVVCGNKNQYEIIFFDCSEESPIGRRSLCYDSEALDARKENKPTNSAVNLATEMGVELLTEEEYRTLQQLGKFDLKTSSWVATPLSIRKLNGALFCDRRYDTVFLYHNGASSYYAARGFRASLKL